MEKHEQLQFDLILFQLINHMNAERSKTGIVRILKGSYAKQTLQDIYLYYVETYYGVFSLLDETEIVSRIDYFIYINYLSLYENRLALEKKGFDYLVQLNNKAEYIHKILSTNKVLHRNLKEQFWKRLVLMIQSLSFLSSQKKDFIPVVNDIKIKEWVKKYLNPKQKQRIPRITMQLFRELDRMKEYMSPFEQQILLLRLHGEHRSALTWKQLEVLLQTSSTELKIQFNLILYNIYLRVCNEKDIYPVLAGMFELDNRSVALSKSTRITFRLLIQGMTIEQVAKKRRLTLGTIYDHFVEIILQLPQSIQLTNYIALWKIETINNLYNQIKSYRLSDYKELLNEQLTYQDIRLVLSYYRVIESDS